MKKSMILIFVVFALLLAACEETPESAENASGDPVGTEAITLRVSPEDRNQAFSLQSFVETPEGYYYGRENRSMGGEMIYFCPIGGKVFYPLCSKPNCRHEDQNCNAYAGVTFGYYNGALYALATSMSKIHPLVHYRIRCETWDHILQREQNSSSTGAVLFISFDTHWRVAIARQSFFTKAMRINEK